MQCSHVFNQERWPKAGDVDDCWVCSAIQCVNVVAAWLSLPDVTQFRKAAGDPDDGDSDGGNVDEIVKGVETLWPEFKGKLRIIRGGTWEAFSEAAMEHRPVSVAVVSAKLPTGIRFGFLGAHQISVAVKASERKLVANPLAPVYSSWKEIDRLLDIQEAVLEYGKLRSGKRSVYAVVFPTDQEMAGTYFAVKPFVEAEVAKATAELEATNATLRGALATCATTASGAVEEAKQAEAALVAFIAKFGG